MDALFLKVLNMSLAASWLILAVVLLRFCLKKAPRWILCLLWALVAVRLVCPVSIESALSLIPSAEVFDAHNVQFETPRIDTGLPAVNSAVNPVLAEQFAPDPAGSINPLHAWVAVGSAVWLLGLILLLLYAAFSYLRLHRSVRESIPLRENIRLCDSVQSPFILGVLRPKIYLPAGMDEVAMRPVIAHEQAHLARRDHWWKPLGFLILAVHWFNPLCWLAYILLCRDIELACDEKVVRGLELAERKAYSAALVECSLPRRTVTVCPLAFGEVGVKSRVKSVLRYRRPALWIAVLAATTCMAAAACFLTDPLSEGSYIRLAKLDTPHSTNYACFETKLERSGTLIAERWSGGQCVSTNPIPLTPSTKQILLYLTPETGEGAYEGVTVQMQTESSDMLQESFPVPEDRTARGVSFVSLDPDEKVPLPAGDGIVIAAVTMDFGNGVRAYDCETLSTEPRRLLEAEYLVIVRIFLTGINSVPGGTARPLSEVSLSYSLDEARADGCLVMEDGSVTSGQETFDHFLQRTRDGADATLRVVNWYGPLDPAHCDPGYYAEEKDRYPALYVDDVYFMDGVYKVFSFEDGKLRTRAFRYLVEDHYDAPTPGAIFTDGVAFFLCDRNDVGYNEVMYSLASSRFGDAIPHHEIYKKLNYKDTGEKRLTPEDAPALSTGEAADLTAGELEATASEVGNFLLFTNSGKITVRVYPGSAAGPCTVKLWDSAYKDTFIMIHELHGGSGKVVFENLTASRRYHVTCEGAAADARIVIRD